MADIPDTTLALAAGLSAGSPELRWEGVVLVLEKAGLGSYNPDALVRAVDVWLLQRGTARARLGALVREVQRG